MGKLNPSHIAGGIVEWYKPKTVYINMFKILIIELPYDPAIPFIGLYLRKLKTHVHTKTSTQMFKATSFIAKKRKRFKCPPSDE